MAKKGTDYQSLIDRIAFESDGLAELPVGEWTLNKLALLSYYLPEFASICERKAGGWYYIDAFAGNGVNRAPGFSPYMGSALIGVSTEPPPRKALLIEAEADRASVLEARCARYSNPTRVVIGDSNAVVEQALAWLDDRYLPAFVVLDPYSTNLSWATVQLLANRRSRSTPYGMLIYFPTTIVSRIAAVTKPVQAAAHERDLNGLFGSEAWKPIRESQRAGHLKRQEAGLQYLGAYTSQLQAFGYEPPLVRSVVRGAGGLMYHLIFVTANAAGLKIMSQGFDRAYGGQLPLQL